MRDSKCAMFGFRSPLIVAIFSPGAIMPPCIGCSRLTNNLFF